MKTKYQYADNKIITLQVPDIEPYFNGDINETHKLYNEHIYEDNIDEEANRYSAKLIPEDISKRYDAIFYIAKGTLLNESI